LADDGLTHVVFASGAAKFAQTSLFSVFSSLSGLTLDPKFNAVRGFTEEEFDEYFVPCLPKFLECNKASGFLPKEASLENLKDEILGFGAAKAFNRGNKKSQRADRRQRVRRQEPGGTRGGKKCRGCRGKIWRSF
jgi:hypothetical protein